MSGASEEGPAKKMSRAVVCRRRGVSCFLFLLSMIFCLQMAEKRREQSSGQERQGEGERQRETETERDREREKEKEREREREGERNERDREARY